MSSDRLYKRGKVWWCWYYDAQGQQVRCSTKCTDRVAARGVLAELERRARDPAYAAAHTTTLGEALKRLLTDRKSKGKAADTIAMYRKKSGHLVRILDGAQPLARLVGPGGARLVDDYIAKRQEEGAGQNTIAKELTTLRATLKVAKRRGEYSGDVSAVMPIGFAPEYKPVRRFVRTAAALEALLDELPLERGAHVCFFVATAARDSEAMRARREHLMLDRSTVYIEGRKTEKSDDTIAVVGWMRPLLEHVLRVTPKKGPLFTRWSNVRRDLHQACTRAVERLRAKAEKARARGHELVAAKAEATAADLEGGLSPNDLRRTHAKWLRAAGVELGLVGRQLRHADPRMVFKVYGQLDATTTGRAIGAALGCDDSVMKRKGSGGSRGRNERQTPRNLVPRDGIEPPTRGFSIHTTGRKRRGETAVVVPLRRAV
jgi:integrase